MSKTPAKRAKLLTKIKKQKKKQKKEELVESDQSEDLEMDEENSIDEEDQIEESHEVHSTFQNAGWADVISKILNKQPKLQVNQESCILTKATKDFELVETDHVKRTERERREWENLNRSRPHVNDRERERRLGAIATRGVVQLFNTISEQKESRRKK